MEGAAPDAGQTALVGGCPWGTPTKRPMAPTINGYKPRLE